MEKKIQIHIEFNNNINLNFKDFYSDFEYIVYFTKEIFDINKNIIIKLIQNNIGIIFSIDYNNINFLIENIDFINDNNICVYLNSYDIKHIERYIFDISRISKLVLVYNITGFENNLYRVLEQLNDILEKIKIYKKYYCDFIINDFEKNYNFIQKYISLFDTNKCSNTLFFNKILKRITYINEYEYLLPYNYVKMNYDNKKIIINNKEIDNNIILI